MKALRKIEPFIENIIIGLLFVAVGFHILKSFNNNFVFKILLGLFVYGITLWALVFKPDSFVHFKQDISFNRILKKVRKDIELNNFKVARDRLHGLISKYPNNLMLKFQLSNIYLMQNDLVRAGRYGYLKPRPSEELRLSIKKFEKSLGNNSFQILKKISKSSKIDIEFVRESKGKISELVGSVQVNSEQRSWVIQGYSYYIKELDGSLYKKLIEPRKDILIHLLILAILLCLTEILRR